MRSTGRPLLTSGVQLRDQEHGGPPGDSRPVPPTDHSRPSSHHPVHRLTGLSSVGSLRPRRWRRVTRQRGYSVTLSTCPGVGVGRLPGLNERIRTSGICWHLASPKGRGPTLVGDRTTGLRDYSSISVVCQRNKSLFLSHEPPIYGICAFSSALSFVTFSEPFIEVWSLYPGGDTPEGPDRTSKLTYPSVLQGVERVTFSPRTMESARGTGERPRVKE